MSAVDPYSGSNGTLHNKLRITDAQTLHQFESNASTIRMAELQEKPIAGKFDLDHLQKIHGHIFQDVYGWAGEIRTVRMAKPPSEFAHPDFIKPEADKLFAKLGAENNLKGLHADQFADRAAYYLSEVNALHPFREGNGRAQQVFFEQLGREAGHTLNFANIPREQLERASILAHSGSHTHLTPVIRDAMAAGRQQQASQGR